MIDSGTIIECAALLAALMAIGAAVFNVVKWFQKQEQQTKDIESLRKKEQEDIQSIKDEQCVVSYAMLACLDGLKQLGADGEVTTAHAKLEKHINQAAHGQKGG